MPKACKSYRPQTKGKVKNLAGYLKKNFMQRKHILTLESLNADIRDWLKQTENRKPNGTATEAPITRWEIREVSKECFIS